MLRSNGHDLARRARFGPLYREAVAALRRGEIPIQGGRDTADRLDDWVAQRLLETEPPAYCESAALDVLVGELYRQAVDQLRRGGIPLLAAVETANKIEEWVRREQLRRCGVVLN